MATIVLILSKTHMKNGKCCVGGITESGRYVRLLNSKGENQCETTSLTPRQVYSISFKERNNTDPPHVEDVLIQSSTLKGVLRKDLKVIDFIKKRNALIWQGNPNALFDSKIKWTDAGSGYINKDNICNNSVGFWVSDKDLTKITSFEKTKYVYKTATGRRIIPYVGFDKELAIIPAGTLLRLSLARWWDTNGTTELRCSLQLSGWYDI